MNPRITTAAAVRTIRAGGVIGIPTDTVYGLACDPRSPAAVDRIYAIKRRPDDLELTLLAATAAQLERLVEINSTASRLAHACWPGPLSLVVPAVAPRRHLSIPRRGHTLSVRIPSHGMLCELLAVTGPLATTSANRHGEPPAVTAGEVEGLLGGELDGVLDGGSGGGGASTIIDCTTTPPRLLREGPISAATLCPLLGADCLPGGS